MDPVASHSKRLHIIRGRIDKNITLYQLDDKEGDSY